MGGFGNSMEGNDETDRAWRLPGYYIGLQMATYRDVPLLGAWLGSGKGETLSSRQV